MPRPSLALFLATAGLLAAASGCARTPEAGPPAAPTSVQPGSGSSPAVPYHNKSDEGGEGGEGGEG
ncbi:hypothetical protein [Cyanobium sp. Morenito 9A2]|uniref:hypothetical protein n=1 Tax=Cyanobium sp. Morenito 9A2 TaxID=2823718 RepID=UPI0020CFD609|nr:hypothetical protein [Cyanobium sp. Morenito 9A2]MCP9848440.1 hypothetical protein [Cyanobium sp. Morenito 9A2]